LGNTLFGKIIIFISIGLFMWLFAPFLKSFFVAFLLVAAFSPIHFAFENRVKKSTRLSRFSAVITASFMTLALVVLLFLPIFFFAYYVIVHPNEILEIGKTFYQQAIRLSTFLPTSMDWLEKPIEALHQKIVANQENIIQTAAMSVGSGVLGFFKAMGDIVMIIAFFFFLSWYRRDLILAIAPVIPIQRKIRQEFVMDMISTTAAGFYTLVGVAIAQGLAFGIFISFFKGYDPLLFSLLIAVSSVIPVVGTALIFVPVALNEFFNGHAMNALIIIIYSWAMLAFFIDNIVRLIILQQLNRFLSKGRKAINDYLIFFAIIAGLITFGFWGFILGPAIAAFVVTLFRILRHNHVVR
jgi:predicted PurR-regulated permease PerM